MFIISSFVKVFMETSLLAKGGATGGGLAASEARPRQKELEHFVGVCFGASTAELKVQHDGDDCQQHFLSFNDSQRLAPSFECRFSKFRRPKERFVVGARKNSFQLNISCSTL